jgi:PST family polysaccharide transporter
MINWRKRAGGAASRLQADGPTTSRRAFFGSIALAFVNVGRLLLQMLVLPILARILGPASFGIVALAMPFILFANLLSDAGMGTALVRRADPSPEVESTVFWLSTGLGVVLAAGLCLAANPLARAMNQPGLASILIPLSPILVLSSSLSVANARISRARHFGLFAVADLVSISLSSAAAIGAAMLGYGPLSLVIQQLALWAAKAAWVLPASRFRPAWVCRPILAMDLLSFGLNSVGANVADFLGRGAPTLIIGSQIGVVAVGQYAMAYQLIRAPDLVLSGPLFLAMFTAVASLASTGSGPLQLSLRTLRMIVSVLAPLFVGLMLTSDLQVALFLGPKWGGAAPVLAALAPAGFFLCLYSVMGAVLMGLGRSDLQFRLALAGSCAMLVGVAVGVHFGLWAASFGVSLGSAAAAPLYVLVLAHQLKAHARRLASTLWWPALATAAMTVAVSAIRPSMTAEPQWAQLAACVLVGAGVFCAVLGLGSGRQLREDLRLTLPGSAVAAPVEVGADRTA